MSMTIAEKLVKDAENWQGVGATKDSLFIAIAAKGVPVPDGAKLADAPGLVDAIQAGGSPSEPVYHDVTFVDYDGTVISNQLVEHGKAAIDPGFPESEYTTALGWLDDFSNVTDNLVVFLSRQSIDGLTRVFITLIEELTGLTVWVNISLFSAGSIIIDYGDGYVLSLPSGTAISIATIPSHTYAVPGDYIITISGTAKITTVSSISGLTGGTARGAFIGTKYSANVSAEFAVKKIIIGDNVGQIQNIGFHRFLTSILLPPTVPNNDFLIYTSAFASNYLSCLIFPTGTKSPSASFMSGQVKGFDYMRYLRYPDSMDGAFGYANSVSYSSGSTTPVNKQYIRSAINLMTYIPTYFIHSAYASFKEIIINAIEVGNGAFARVSGIEKIKLNSTVKKIGGGAFYSLRNCQFEVVAFSQMTHIYSDAFVNSSLDGSIDLPSTCSAVIGAFGNTNVAHLKISNVIAGNYSSSNSLFEMPLLSYLDLQGTMNITNLINYAPKLKGVIIRNLTPPTITSTAFIMSGLDNVVLHVYVPDEAWDAYIVATNWVTLYSSGKLHKISEYVD